MAVITTVRGDIAPETFGACDMHDHAFMSMETAGEHMANMFGNIPKEMLEFKPENYNFLKTGVLLLSPGLQNMDSEEIMTKEYGYLKGMGVNALCEPSPIGIRGDINKYRKLSRNTGICISYVQPDFIMKWAISAEYRGHDEDYYYNLFKK